MKPAELTRRDKLDAVLKGIDGAAEAGLWPIKINAVLMPGLNDDQAPELLRWALAGGYQLRFIEQMPLDADNRWTREARLPPLRFVRSCRLSTFWVRWLRHRRLPLSCGRCNARHCPG